VLPLFYPVWFRLCRVRGMLLAGTCQIEATPGMGTTVFLRAPLTEAFPRSESINKLRFVWCDHRLGKTLGD
jgi:hypothetical protein